MTEKTYFVRGMHCASCEILIERKLLEQKGVKSVEAKTSKGEVTIEFTGNFMGIEELNRMFIKFGYTFSDKPRSDSKEKKNDLIFIAGIAGFIIFIFLLLNRLGLNSVISVSSQSSLPMFFLFGIIAGVSGCAALVGGIVLSLSKQWAEIYNEKKSTFEKFQPHLLFNSGRIVSFTLLGGALGFLGKQFGISLAFTSFLVIGVSLLMFLMGLQMVGIKYFQRFQLTTPKFVTRYIADEKNFKGRFMPALMGGLTFFLPCGFTITTQGLALVSGSPIMGGLIMLAFVLGTTPTLLGIGLSSLKLSENSFWSVRFTKIAGVLVLFFALFNLNSQLNVLGLSSFNDLTLRNKAIASDNQEGLPPLVSGVQVIKMNASASGYSPNYFKVRAGVPVRWEITDTGTSGCTNAIISKGLFDGQIPLNHNQTSIKEFTPEKPGKYKFSCWMGMVSGIIEVVDKSGISSLSSNNTSEPVSSGASGCGCGGGK